MKARELLKKIQHAKVGEPIQIPFVIDSEDLPAEAFWKILHNLIEKKSPSFIEIIDIYALHQVRNFEKHFKKDLEKVPFLSAVFKKLFSLPVAHIHFNFENVDNDPFLISSILHYIARPYKAILNSDVTTEISPILSASINDPLTFIGQFDDLSMYYGEKSVSEMKLAKARVYAKNNEYDNAIALHEEIPLTRRDSDFYFSRGLIYIALEEKQKAIDDFNQIIRLENTHKDKGYYMQMDVYLGAHFKLAKIYLSEGGYANLVKAKKYFEIAQNDAYCYSGEANLELKKVEQRLRSQMSIKIFDISVPRLTAIKQRQSEANRLGNQPTSLKNNK